MKLTINFINNGGAYEIYNPANHPMRCFVVPRNQISSSLIHQIDKDSQGHAFVYFLVDKNEARKEVRKFYIGETVKLYNRLTSHKSSRKWWTHVFLFTDHSNFLKEEDVKALEKMLFEKYFPLKDKFYDFDNSEASDAKDNDDLDDKLDYIVDVVLEFLDYGIKFDDLGNNDASDQAINKVLTLGDEIDSAIKSIDSKIGYDQLKLYRGYSLNKKGILALWPLSSGVFEAELYTSVDKITVTNKAYDTSNRKRGNKKAAFKIKDKNDIKILVEIIREMLGKKATTVAPANQKRAPFKFSMIGLKVGDVIYYSKDASIKCKIISDDQVSFNGQTYTLTALAKKLLGKTTGIRGPEFFTYNGKKLTAIRDEKGV